MQAGFFDRTPAFTMIAGGAGGDNVGPNMFSTHVPWKDVIDGQIVAVPTAVLAREIISTKDFLARQLDPDAGPGDHFFQAND